MDKNQISRVIRRPLMALVVPAFCLNGVVAANAQRPNDQARMAEHAERVVTRLTEELNLTSSQIGLFEKTLQESAQRGSLWSLAAELEPTLIDAQKALLFTRPERDSRRHPPGQQRPNADEHQAAEQRARDSALGLSDQQSRQMDEVHERHESEREQAHEQMRQSLGERPEPGELPYEIASILTPDQQEIVKVFHALRGRMPGPRGGRGSRGPQDGGPRRGR